MSKKLKNKKNDVLLPDAVLSTPQTTAQKSGLRGVYLVGKNQSQKDAIRVIESHDVSILYGVPGSGKSHIAMAMGLKELMEGKYERLILTRPYVEAGESMGYLPGGINAKIAPFIYPLMEIASDLCGNGDIVMKFINAGNITIMPFAYMRGMAQPLTSQIVTPAGFVEMGSLCVGDEVIGVDGKPTKVTGVFPQGEKVVYKITFSDGSSTECCGDHLWSTQTRSEKRWGRGYTVKKTTEILATLKNRHGSKNHEIPLTSPVEFAPQPIDLDPYLVGSLLGDGSLNPQASITFTTSEDEMANLIRTTLPDNIELVYASQYDYRLVYRVGNGKGNPLRRALERLNLIGTVSETKFIPDCYKYNSVSVRTQMLQGLMDTDGSIFLHRSGKFRMAYYSVSEQLARDVLFLVQSLGGTGHLRCRKVNSALKHLCNGRAIQSKQNCWIVDFSIFDINPFRLSRKANKFNSTRPKRLISAIEELGKKECQCISVEDHNHLYLTDQFIVTHNTFKKSFVIADEMQNSTIKQTRLLLTRLGEKSKLVMTGDTEQSDLYNKYEENGLTDAVTRLRDVPEIGFHKFDYDANVRSELVNVIEKKYRKQA